MCCSVLQCVAVGSSLSIQLLVSIAGYPYTIHVYIYDIYIYMIYIHIYICMRHVCIYDIYTYMYIYIYDIYIYETCIHMYDCACASTCLDMRWLRLVGSLKSQVSFTKEPYNRDDILQKRPIILRSLLNVTRFLFSIWGGYD